MTPITKEQIAKIKTNIEYWGNNCGGCEPCSVAFGDKDLTFTKEEVYDLILYIEDLESRLEAARYDWDGE